eukprot:gene14549-22262_t
MRTVPDKVPAEFEGVASPARCRRAAETSRENGRGLASSQSITASAGASSKVRRQLPVSCGCN